MDKVEACIGRQKEGYIKREEKAEEDTGIEIAWR